MQYALAAGAALAVTAPTPHPPAKHHAMPKYARQYSRAYKAVQAKLGHRAPGRNLVRWGTSKGRRATDRQIVTSLGVLRRMLLPPVHLASPQASSATVSTSSTASVATAPASGLAACIVQHESGGDPQASNGTHFGIGQWLISTWQADGGGQYASTPLGASYSQQLAVLNNEGAAGMQQQQGQYDGCTP